MKTYINYLLLSACLLLTTTLASQNPNFEWAKKIGGTSLDEGKSITTDADGNVYSTGYFNGVVNFDTGTGTTILTSNGSTDIYIQKLNATGDLLWVKQMGGADVDFGFSIQVDMDGNVYTTGFFEGVVDFDPGAGTTILTSNGGRDAYIQKLDVGGNFLYAKQMGGIQDDYGFSLTVDASGNLYTAGYFKGTVDFNPGPGTTNLTSSSSDIYIQKLDPGGNFIWVKQIPISGPNDFGLSITTDGIGNVYTLGVFYGTVDFDPGPGTMNFTSNGGYDIFIQKLDAGGNLVWAKQMGGTEFEYSRSIIVDGNGSVYSSGNFKATVDFDPGPGTTNLTSNGAGDIFIQKLDASGNFLWAKQMGGTINDIVESIAVDATGSIYTTGYFAKTVDFDPGPGILNLTSKGNADIFILKLDASGNLDWVKQMGGTNYDTGLSIALDPSGYIYTTGFFYGTADFDPDAGITTLTSNGSSDIFIQKLSQCEISYATDVQTAYNSYTWIDGNTYTTSNNTATYNMLGGAANGCDSLITLDLTINRGVLGEIRLLLEGPYDAATGLMTDYLRTAGFIPTTEPYTALGFTQIGGGNESVAPAVLNISGPNAIVDWIFLELRDAADFSKVVSTRSALLQADGDVVDTDGISKVVFYDIQDGNYYVVAKHRNHISVMTPGSLPMAQSTSYLHDFTTGSAYGLISSGDVQKPIGTGKFGLYEADFNHSGAIDAADRSIAWNNRNLPGYTPNDSNFDGTCNAAERSQAWNNRNKTSRVP